MTGRADGIRPYGQAIPAALISNFSRPVRGDGYVAPYGGTITAWGATTPARRLPNPPVTA